MSSDNKRVVIDTVNEDGTKLKLAIKIPGHKILQEASMIYNIRLTALIRRSISDDCQLFSREQLEQHLGDLGIWTEKDARQFLQLQLELRSSELKLKQGGIKISEAKKMALQMKAKRAMMLALYNRRSQFDSITMESMADNDKFKFLITKCVVLDESDLPFFANIDDYENRQGEKASVDAATALAGQLYGYDKHTESNLVENQWLKRFEFADENGRLINDDGKLIDINNHLINEDGRFIDAQGRFVDNEGRLIDESGDFVVDETKPFIDDRNKPVIVEEKKKIRKKRETKAKKK